MLLMETILLEILELLRDTKPVGESAVSKIIRRHNRHISDISQHFSKKRLLPFYLKIKEQDPARWATWKVDAATERRLIQALRVKPRRTASGVAIITVITKPWRCSSDCLYCPNDLRMPKSYLNNEPACQRAERNFFDPYLQVTSRLRTLIEMGHTCDKVELIILGGTWSDYPMDYQTWFITELFRALNDGVEFKEQAEKRRLLYEGLGLQSDDAALKEFVQDAQRQVDNGSLSYNQAFQQLYCENSAWKSIAREQQATFDELTRQQSINETAAHRAVGLVIETRPDSVTSENLLLLRLFGCTKVQIGIQSLNPAILEKNNRHISLESIQNSFELLRVFGFKIHAHFMLNLFGSTPEEDKRMYKRFVTEKPWQPDEIKLYPCALIGNTRLSRHYADKSWLPYTEEELVDVLAANVLDTPSFIRISRMIRDFSAQDIVAGNKKTNLRQAVERSICAAGARISEIRFREISTSEIDVESLVLETLLYETTVSQEFFLQWVTPENKIAGFLRLSLPDASSVAARRATLPVGPYEAMIREVHIYGKVARLHKDSNLTEDASHITGNPEEGTQHLGLGKQLIEAACEISHEHGYTKVNVISSVGTREYYRNLGFADNGLYQQKPALLSN